MTDPLPLLIIILGPTAAGKTAIAVKLAGHLKTEIISCDSRQFYRELNIGVARPSDEELRSVVHHFIGFLPVTESYNAGRYETDTLDMLNRLFQEKKVMVMAGGSGLYIHAITHGIDRLVNPDPVLREQLVKDINERGLESLQRKLLELDPLYFSQMDNKNPKRLIRALEVCLSTGQPYSSLRTGKPAHRPFRVLKIGIKTGRQELVARIEKRVDCMMEAGLLEEVRSLIPFRDMNALNTVGYKELFAYLDGRCSLEEAVGKIKTDTRRYAKRQMTWFRKDPDVRWFDPDDLNGIIGYAT